MSTARRAALLSATLLLAMALLLSLAVAATAAPKVNGAVTGFVVDPAGKGVAGVKVSVCEPLFDGTQLLTWTPTYSALTGKAGKYTITAPAGTYRVWFEPADRDAHCMEAYPNAPIPDLGNDVVVRVGATTKNVSIMLDGDPAWLWGHVYDASTASPLPGIEVRLAYQPGAIVNTILLGATSDSEGYYRLSGLKPYTYWGIWGNQMPPDWLDWPYDPGYGLFEFWPETPIQYGHGYEIDVLLPPLIP